MTFFEDVDRLVATFKASMIEAKVAARETGYTRIKATDTGVWSAKKAWDGGGRVDARSGMGLVEVMRRDPKPPPVDPKKLEARALRLKAYRAKLKRESAETKEQRARRLAARRAGR